MACPELRYTKKNDRTRGNNYTVHLSFVPLPQVKVLIEEPTTRGFHVKLII